MKRGAIVAWNVVIWIFSIFVLIAMWSMYPMMMNSDGRVIYTIMLALVNFVMFYRVTSKISNIIKKQKEK